LPIGEDSFTQYGGGGGGEGALRYGRHAGGSGGGAYRPAGSAGLVELLRGLCTLATCGAAARA
jgi:hypothetical protein